MLIVSIDLETTRASLRGAGAPVEIYQLQPAVAGGVKVRTQKGAGELPPPFVLHPNPDGSFGGAGVASMYVSPAVTPTTRASTGAEHATRPHQAQAAAGAPITTDAHLAGDGLLEHYDIGGENVAADDHLLVDDELLEILRAGDGDDDGADGDDDDEDGSDYAGEDNEGDIEDEAPKSSPEPTAAESAIAVVPGGEPNVAVHSASIIVDGDEVGSDTGTPHVTRSAEETEALMRAVPAGRALLEQRDAAKAELAQAVAALTDAQRKAETTRSNAALRQMFLRLESAALAKAQLVSAAETRLAAIDDQLRELEATL
jgi:hypothetical protein